jgi:hypothetical protein
MQEYKIKIGNREYTLNSNNGKYDRVFNQKFNPEFNTLGKLTNEQILAYYDSFGGLILDENRGKISSGEFWKAYKEKLVKANQQKISWGKKKDMANTFVVFTKGFKEVLWIIIIIVFLGSLYFGDEKMLSIIKSIKEVI